jgi:mevalonate kinase
MLSKVEFTTHGKWILAGEHAVLRGHSALVFPVLSTTLTLTYDPSSPELNADFFGDSGTDLHLLFWSVIEQGVQLLGKSINALQGHFSLKSNIPVGVGLGASAALCMAIARWFVAQHFLLEPELQSFASQLEHLFHGKSSGLDIAGVAASQGIEFTQGQSFPLRQTWNPQWYLSSCGQIGITSHCINQVQLLWEKDPALAGQIDQEMAESVHQARNALEENTANSLNALAHAINRAANCFRQWGLVSESLDQHMLMLKEAGALAVKPTGSGGGGFVISLWEQAERPAALGLISI